MQHGYNTYLIELAKAQRVAAKLSGASSIELSAGQESKQNTLYKTGANIVPMMFVKGSLPSWAQHHDKTKTNEYLGCIAHKMKQAGSGTSSKDGFQNIPAGYTYLAQFVFHDLTRSHILPSKEQKSHQASSLNSASLDLDTLYGFGPMFDPQLFEREEEGFSHRCRFRIGEPGNATSGNLKDAHLPRCPFDLARIRENGAVGQQRSVDPIIADVRNDDHLILSQLLVLFKEVHNKVVATGLSTGLDNEKSYQKARLFLTQTYRYIVINDFLRKILTDEVYADFTKAKPEYIASSKIKNNELAAEFTFAASRFGHSMVRHRYPVNKLRVGKNEATITQILQFSSANANPDLPLPADWAIDWRFFFDLDTNPKPVPARRISPLFAPSIADAVTVQDVAEAAGNERSLAFLDMERCLRFELPTGQQFFNSLNKTFGGRFSNHELSSEQMRAQSIPFALPTNAQALDAALSVRPKFYEETPLSYYILQEASVHGKHGSELGLVGSYIVATTIYNALAIPPVGSPGGLSRSTEIRVATAQNVVNTMPKLIGLLDQDNEQLLNTLYRSDEELSRQLRKPARRFHEAGE